MSDYKSLLNTHSQLESFRPFLPTSLLPTLALLSLLASFILTQYFFSLKASKSSSSNSATTELGVAVASAAFAGLGGVTAFCALGVNV
ncbi:hypothetical protein T439DRAFT_323257 [Meredithblackwellia eburnea MCA 4105]